MEQDRARDERAAARAQFREPEPEPAAVAVAAPAAPASETASDSGSEGFGEASGADLDDFSDFLRGAQVYANDPVSFQDDPTEAAKADVSSAREESQRSARESAVAAADEEQTGEDYLDMVVTELEGKPLSPEQWYGTVITAIDQASPELKIDALRTFTEYLVETDLTPTCLPKRGDISTIAGLRCPRLSSRPARRSKNSNESDKLLHRHRQTTRSSDAAVRFNGHRRRFALLVSRKVAVFPTKLARCRQSVNCAIVCWPIRATMQRLRLCEASLTQHRACSVISSALMRAHAAIP